MKRNYRKRKIRICKWCLQEMQYYSGKQNAFAVYVNPKDEKESFCAFCKHSGFDSLYVV